MPSIMSYYLLIGERLGGVEGKQQLWHGNLQLIALWFLQHTRFLFLVGTDRVTVL